MSGTMDGGMDGTTNGARNGRDGAMDGTINGTRNGTAPEERVAALLGEFECIARSPSDQLNRVLQEGGKAVGVFPYYSPEELVHAAGFVPFGIWGAQGTVREAGRYFPAFYCTIARMGLELALTGVLDRLSGVVMPTLCDTLRPLSQNFKAAKPDLPMLFLAQPQNRRTDYGVAYYRSELVRMRAELAEMAGAPVTDESIASSIAVYNASRAERRRFVRLAGCRSGFVSAQARSAVLKSACFAEKSEHTAKLVLLNDCLDALPADASEAGESRPLRQSRPPCQKIVTSGILADSPDLLRIFDAQGLVIGADDVAQESRSFLRDVPMPDACTGGDPLHALAQGFAAQTDDSLLWEPELTHRADHLLGLVKGCDARGVVFVMMQFCDPEELDYPQLKAALDEAGIPSIQVGFDQQMRDFGQAETQLMSFAE
ncbi:MAG: 2-hydroxyacyl-CoA dehydratase family protein, partial [Clostridiales Family XIII bacterium]|nr:2-hydroxyacyl-CoA dehydratase family protein [Clostridiales Family XIII bacterium]